MPGRALRQTGAFGASADAQEWLNDFDALIEPGCGLSHPETPDGGTRWLSVSDAEYAAMVEALTRLSGPPPGGGRGRPAGRQGSGDQGSGSSAGQAWSWCHPRIRRA